MGKSSLLNAVVGRKAIARTSKTPGKTRDCNVYRIAQRLYLVDLPGYGYARVPKTERRRLGTLIETYLATRERLVGAVWLLDVRRDPSDRDLALAAQMREWQVPILVAITKGDKLSRSRRTTQTQAILQAVEVPSDQAVVTSAVTKEGVDDLADSILALVTETQPS